MQTLTKQRYSLTSIPNFLINIHRFASIRFTITVKEREKRDGTMKVREKKKSNNSISETREEERSSAFISSPASKLLLPSFFLYFLRSFFLSSSIYRFLLQICNSLSDDRNTVPDAIQLMDHKKSSRTTFHISNKTFLMKFQLFLCLAWDCIWLSFHWSECSFWNLTCVYSSDPIFFCADCPYLEKYRGVLYRYSTICILQKYIRHQSFIQTK